MSASANGLVQPITYSGAWGQSNCACFLADHTAFTTTTGARATFTRTYEQGDQVALVMAEGPGRGKASIPTRWQVAHEHRHVLLRQYQPGGRVRAGDDGRRSHAGCGQPSHAWATAHRRGCRPRPHGHVVGLGWRTGWKESHVRATLSAIRTTCGLVDCASSEVELMTVSHREGLLRRLARLGAVPETTLDQRDGASPASEPGRRTQDFRSTQRETFAAPKRPTGHFTPTFPVPNVTNHDLQSDTRPATSMHRAGVLDRPIRLQLRSPVFHACRREDPCSLRATGGLVEDRPPERFLRCSRSSSPRTEGVRPTWQQSVT
jgi:hypothetical protein